MRTPWTEILQLHPILLLLDTFLEHFLELKLWILCLISNLGKSGVHNLKRCMIWSWNEEVMAVWRRLCKQWAEMSQPHPHFTTVGHIFGALPGAQIIHTICRFEAREFKSPMLQTVHDLELKRRSYVRLKMSAQSWAGISQSRRHLEGCFAAVKPPLGTRVPLHSTVRPFCSCKMGCKNPPPLRNPPPATKMLQALKWAAKFPFGCEMFSQPHSYPLWNYPWAAKNVFLYSLWLQDDLQAAKWPPSYKNDLQNEERFAKTLCKAKGSCENANKAPHHAYEEESPLTEITHMKPLIPFLTSLNHQRP